MTCSTHMQKLDGTAGIECDEPVVLDGVHHQVWKRPSYVHRLEVSIHDPLCITPVASAFWYVIGGALIILYT